MAWGSSMHSNAEHARNRTLVASVMRLLLAPLALFVSVHSTSVGAAEVQATSSASGAGIADGGLAGARVPGGGSATAAGWAEAADGAEGESEVSLCDLADVSLPMAPGSCEPREAEAALAQPSNHQPSPTARSTADPSAEGAPMCDVSAASIAATAEIPPPRDRARFEPLPCDQQRLLSLLRSGAREHCAQLIDGEQSAPGAPQPPPSRAERPDGACALSVQLAWPDRAAASLLPEASHRGLTWQPGHVSRPYRPPSLRA
jgi:hypothetical protein